MAGIAYARLFLRHLKRQSENSSSTLISVLESSAFSQVQKVESGLVFVSVSQNGHSVQSEVLPSSSGVTPSAIAELCSEMLDLYDSARAALVASGLTVPSDDLIYASMLDRLQSVKSYKPNFGATAYA